MLDLSKVLSVLIVEKPIATGVSVDIEGAALVSVLEDGVEKVKPCTGAAGEKFVGFSYNAANAIEFLPFIEEGVVPSASPYTITLKHANLVPDEIRIYDATAGSDLTLGDPSLNAGEFSVDWSSGVVTFNAAEAGHDVVIYYRYSPSLVEVKSTFFEAGIGTNAGGVFGRVGVIVAPCEIYTSEYDVTKDWSNATDIRLGANGRLTVGGTGTAINARVIKVPTADNPLLGIALS